MSAQPYHFKGCTIRQQTRESLDDWATQGIPTGSFLAMVLENNLTMATLRADPDNRTNMTAIAGYLVNEMPSACWGSPEKVKAWQKAKKTAA